MGIFSRLTDIVNANLNSLLDKAEDPPKMVRLIIQEMEEGLVRERSNLARYLADKKELRRQQERNQSQLQDWQSKAELALQKGRDDLARAALIEKGKQQQLVDALSQEFSAVEEGIAKLTAEIELLEAKLEDARGRQKAMLLRSAAAQSRLNVQQHGQRATPHSIMEKFDRMERKIEEMESKADVYHPNPSLQQQFAELEADDAISRELAAMKERLQTAATKEE
ncbi:MAG: phage shock protein PspA [Aeromonadaceae bacterium]|nr:phage shock protein PspA [Aeromonadaceae bacterium]